MLDEWRDGAYVRLVPNPHYWNKDEQYLDELTFLFIPPEVNRVNALKAGDIDFIYVTRGFIPDLEEDPTFPWPRDRDFPRGRRLVSTIRSRRTAIFGYARHSSMRLIDKRSPVRTRGFAGIGPRTTCMGTAIPGPART